MSEHWLQHELSSLLSSPGPIRIPRLPFGLRGGPGPIDVFSSRFANLFSDDVRATINGIDYDKAGLKDKVIELKQYYDPDSATEELAESTRNHVSSSLDHIAIEAYSTANYLGCLLSN
jgi:hypothetical protein